MAALIRWMKTAIRRAPLPPLRFPTTGFDIISDEYLLEEEQFEEGFEKGLYYPVNIGDVFASKYQVHGKLGCGITSTVWLARDLQTRKHVTLKVYIRDGDREEEFKIYQRLRKGNQSHPGYSHIRTALETFTIPRPGGDHICLVQEPMGLSHSDVTEYLPDGLFTENILGGCLSELFKALDYLHTECKLVHTDIKADNLLSTFADESILSGFTESEMKYPAPRKFVNGATVYASRPLGLPKFILKSVLSDFGSAVQGDIKRNHMAGANTYRVRLIPSFTFAFIEEHMPSHMVQKLSPAPEVMLEAAWSYPVDIWTVGVMVWDLFEGKHMFHGKDPDGKKYSTRAHLAEVMGMLGPPPLDLVEKGVGSFKYFDEDGNWIAKIPIPQRTSLEESEIRLQGKNKEMFLELMRGMLQWRPEDRKTAKQLLEDPWLKGAILQ
ncbi:Serine/threonine-protein kinase SRPK [Lachnellula cervina]|uniref:non-specific serine/threonine protein kinase n=1 Tax=Lachnellula cervina TaxID=1316786 RepID=A0A7D8Z0I1_9HELO|nr:Serine/threonine-protein kinase SRPK [Lachnellula cervina]